LVFILARCALVRQKLVPRVLSANRNLALNFRSVPPLKIKGYRKLALVFSYDSIPENKRQAGDYRRKAHQKNRRPFTEDEYKTILALESELGICKTDLVRTRLLAKCSGHSY